MVATVGSIQIQLSADLQNVLSGFGRTTTAITGFSGKTTAALGRFDKSVAVVTASSLRATTAVRRFGSVLGTLGIGAGTLSVAGVIKYADAWTRASNSLRVSGVAAGEVAGVLDRLYGIAQSSGAALEPTVTLFGRLSQAAGELGASREQLFAFTEGIGNALKVAGTDAGAASGALLQLSQALGGTVVRAEEFNSINEGARPILQAVADGLDAAGGSVAKLQTLVNDGKVTSKAFFDAFLKGSRDLKEQAAAAATTVSQAITKINNALTKYIGETDQGLGASQRLVQALNALADNFDKTADVALRFAAVIAAALLGRTLGRMIAALPEAALAVSALATALRTGAIAAGGFAAAMGPIGLLLGAAAAALAIMASGNYEAEAAADAHREALEKVNPVLEDLKKASNEALQSVRGLGDAWITSARKAVASAVAQAQAMRSLAEADAAMMIGEPEGGRGATFTDRDFDTVARVSEVAGRDPRYQAQLRALNEAANRLNEAQAAIDKIEAEAASRGLPSPNGTGGGSGSGSGNGRSDEEEKRIQRVIEGLQFEEEQLSRTARERAVYQELQKAGVDISSEEGQKIAALAGGLWDQEAALKANADRMAEIAGAAKDFASTFIGGLRQGKSAAESLGDAVDRLVDKLLDNAINMFIQALLGMLTGGGSLIGGGLFAKGGKVGKVPGFSRGGILGFAKGGLLPGGGRVKADRDVLVIEVLAA